MSEFKIDKGVPLTPDPRGRPRKYPFAEMEIGDSFYIKTEIVQEIKASRWAATAYGQRNNRKFTTRIQDGGVRIWRIA